MRDSRNSRVSGVISSYEKFKEEGVEELKSSGVEADASLPAKNEKKRTFKKKARSWVDG